MVDPKDEPLWKLFGNFWF